MDELTNIIQNWHKGDKDAEAKLYHFAYQQLRSIAQKERQRSAEKYGAENKVLQDSANNTTALIHDAYLKLASSDMSHIKNRRQFYLMVSKVMRQILIDNARAISAQKRQVSCNNMTHQDNNYIDQLISIEKALDHFSLRYPRQSDVVKLKYFMGLKTQEISTLLECSNSLIEKDLKFSRSWLQMQIA